jgi:hypothetical protein
MKILVKIPDLFAGMNQLEKRRAVELEALKRSGVVAEWRYEKITLKLADDTRYTPDFWIVDSDGAVNFEETKGHWRDDAKVKLKVAAEQFPEFTFRSLIWNRQLNTWDITNY